MERRYLSVESVKDFDFEKTISYGDRRDANLFEKGVTDENRNYIKVDLVYANEGLLKILFNDFDDYRLKQWSRAKSREGINRNWDIDGIVKCLACEEPFMIYLECYEDGEVDISFLETFTYIVEGGTFRLVGDGVPLLLEKVKKYAKMKGIDFDFAKGYTIYDGCRYFKSYDGFFLGKNVYLEELEKLGVSFDEFVEYIVNNYSFIISDVYTKLVTMDGDSYDTEMYRECVEYYKEKNLIDIISKLGTKEEKLRILDDIKQKIENGKI